MGPVVQLDRTPPPRAPAPMLDAQQQAVIDHRDGHLLVLAGPGTGKTTTLAELVVSRLAPGAGQLDAGSVLALTFGRRAARELAERISQRLAGGPVPVVSTFHAFAYGVLRQYADPTAFLSPPRLLTAAEQEARLRELLTYSILEGRLEWPESLSGAVGTRGIAEQVRALLARARGQGLDGPTLASFGRRAGVPVWTSVGRFFQEYLDTLGFEGTLDYAELIHQAVALASKEREGRALRETYRLIVVDEYQDTDPAQVRLLRELARGGAQVVAVGDPDQAIYGFRGADVGGILQFAEAFRDPATGAPARIEVLRTTRRFPRPIAEAAHRILGPVPLGGLPAEVQRLHRTPVTAAGPARVEARTYPSASAEATGVVEALLRAHAGLAGGEPLRWSQMAVLVRNPAVHGPALARAMRAAGIPVAVPPDELALADEPAVGVLLGVVGLALDESRMPPDTGRMLLAGPLGRVDPVAVRALARAALLEHRRDGGEEPRAGSDALLTGALSRGQLPGAAGAPAGTGVPASARDGFARVARAVAAVRDALAANEMVSEALWAAWAATDWPERMRTAALRAGPNAGSANRDLDAVVSLFDLANRLPAQRRGRIGMEAFLADVRALRLPQEVAQHAEAERDMVRLISAHRAKGLEWELVVVASVQEGQWPDIRLRSDLLRIHELGTKGRLAARSHGDLLAEERRLMYVACTRARATLLVSAVAEPVEGGAQPSRFLAELGVPIVAMPGRASSPMAGPGLVTALRAAATAPVRLLDDGTPDPAVEALRGAAVQRLAAVARHVESGRLGGAAGPLAGADPARWWGVQPVTWPVGMAEPPDAAQGGTGCGIAAPGLGDSSVIDQGTAGVEVRLSPSAVEALRTCPLQWFLERKVGAGTPSGAAASVGVVVHAVAEALARGEVEADLRAIAPFVDEIWSGMPFAARYQSAHERERVDEMITALLDWHRSTGRTVHAAEAPFALSLPTLGGTVAITGKIDRVDRSDSGALYLVDFKTGRSAATAAAAAEHPQLGVYQLAVREGALAGAAPGDGAGPGDAADPAVEQPPGPDRLEPTVLGGAELVHLADRYASGMPKVRVQDPIGEGWTWVHDVVLDAARLAAGPRYPARRNGRCATCSFRVMCPAQGAQRGAP